MDTLHVNVEAVNALSKIPFLPISFFKTHEVKTTSFDPEIIFESSGTTGTRVSRHLVKSMELYEKCFLKTFRHFYGNEKDWCILGLLPGYLERGNSSLVKMVEVLIERSDNTYSGFYLGQHEKLYQTLVHNELMGQPTLLIGVTFALLDFAEKYEITLEHTTIMETGGMKGRREEMTRDAVHNILKQRFGVESVHTEYGMTELLSQAYAAKDGLLRCPGWMKILLREYNDPFAIRDRTAKPVSGLVNIIDLANLYSCAFIATDDIGRLHKNGDFEILGRRDVSDIRGCSLLTA